MSNQLEQRYFTSYSGVKLPLKLVGEIVDGEAKQNRNTYFLGQYDANNRLLHCQKLVYGEVELDHRYFYRDDGSLERAEIVSDEDDVETLWFDHQGQRCDGPI